MSNGHVRTGAVGNQSGGHDRRRRPAARGRRLGVTTALTGLVGMALVATTTPPASAADPTLSAQAKATSTAVQSLSLTLDQLAATPTLQARLPLAGQSVSDVLGLDTLFASTLGAAASTFAASGGGAGGLSDLVSALDKAGAPRGIDVSLDPAGDTVVIDLAGTTDGFLYALHSDERLFLDGTNGDTGRTPVTGTIDGTLRLDIAADDSVTLDPTNSAIGVELDGSRADLAVASRYGFSDVTAKGATDYRVTADFDLNDPDGSLAITPSEWQTTPFTELAFTTVGGAVDIGLGLDSDLVPGTGNGTVTQALTATQMKPTARGDGSFSFDAPEVTADAGLTDLAKVTAGDAIVALSQMAAAYSNAQARMDPRLPLVDTAVSELGSAAEPLNKLIESQGAAAVSCGRANTSPPAATTVPGTTWYCQARTAEPIAGKVKWSVTGGGAIQANGENAATVGTNPTQNVAITGSAVEPEVSVTFDATSGDGTTASFTAQRRIRTAQELAARLSALPGEAVTKAAYNASARALTFPVVSASNPDAASLSYNFADLFRPDARLRGISVDPGTDLAPGPRMSVDLGTVSMAGTLGLLLEKTSTDATPVAVSDRAFLAVDGSDPEVSVAGITANGEFSADKATGMVGMTKVALKGSGLALSTSGATPLRADIKAASSIGGRSNAAMLSDVLSGVDDPASVETVGSVALSAAGTLTASADELPGGTYTAELDYPVDLKDTVKDQAKPATVTLSDGWRDTLKPQDVAPQVAGAATSADATGKVLTDETANFLDGVLGPKLVSGTVLTLSLVNLRTGAQCSAFQVAATTLTCVEQGETTGGDLTPTWRASALAGGKIEDPDGLKTADNFDNYKTDNAWLAGDPYVIEGDPTAVRSVALGGLYDAADGIQQSQLAGWITPIPLIGIAPSAFVPQLQDVREAAAAINNLADEPREECDQPGGCPGTGALETAPADLDALRDRVATKLKATVPGATVALDVQSVDGKPALVLDVTAPDSGSEPDLALSFPVENGTEYWLRQLEGGTAVKPTWSSEVRLRIAVPTNPDTALDQVKVLKGSGVTKMRVQVGSETVDLRAGLGPADVQLGVKGGLTGTAQDPDPNPVSKVTGTVAVSGTNTGTGTTLLDATTKLANLSGTTTKAVRGSDKLECTGASASGDGLSCTLPPDTTTTPEVARSWASGEAYTLTYTSPTWLTDTAADFMAKGVVIGDVVRTYKGAGATRTVEGACVVKTVLLHQLECTSALTNAKSFTNGVAYQVLPNVLVDPGRGFEGAGLIGKELTNTTTGATCTIASAKADYLACEGAKLTGTGRTWFEPGDGYSVPASSTIKADVAFTMVGASDALVPAYMTSLTPKLGNGAGAPVSCGTGVSGALCAAVSASTVKASDGTLGQVLGDVTYAATIDGTGIVTPTVKVADNVKNLDDGTTPLALGSLGDVFGDAGGAVSSLADSATDGADLPLVGSDATAGSWLVPLLDAYGLELGETMMKGALGNLPEDTPLNNIDSKSTSYPAALEKAARDAAGEVVTPDGTTMGDVLSFSTKLTCGTAACDLSKNTVGDVTGVEIPLKLGKDKATTYQVPFESGLAGLPLAADFRLNSAVTWDLNLTLGIDRTTGPYLDLTNSKLGLTAAIELPTSYEAGDGCPVNPVSTAFDSGSPFAGYNPKSCQSLTLGLLQATAYDGKDGERSQATIDLGIDLDKAVNGTAKAIAAGELKDLTVSQGLAKVEGVDLVAKGRLNMYFVTGVNPRNGNPDAALPSVHGIIDMKFNQAGDPIWTVAKDLDKAWSVEYRSLYLDAGTFVDKFAGDVIRGVAKQVKPYKPLIDAVRAPVPVISDIAMLMGQEQVSLLDILSGASGSSLGFVRKAVEVLDIVANISDAKQNLLIPLGASPVDEYDPVKIGIDLPDLPVPDVKAAGSFKTKPKQSKSGPCGGAMTLNPNPQAAGANGVNATGTQKSPQATKTERRMPKDCTSTDKGGSVLRGSTKVIQTQPCASTGCTGKERATTISKAIGKPKLTGTAISFPFMEDFSEVFGLLLGEDATLVRLDLGTLRATAGIGLKFGPFMAGPVPVDIGVGLSVTFGAHLALGYDTLGLRNALLNDPGTFDPSAMLDGLYIDDYDAAGNETPEMTLTLAVQLEGSVSIKIFRVGIYGGVSITLAGDLNDPNKDGKLRIKEIRAVDNPICLFELSGWMDFFLGFFVEVDLFIKTFRYDVELYRLKPPLKLFEIRCEPKPPVLGVESGGNLVLKMGTNKTGRNVSEDEPKERFKIKQLGPVVQGQQTPVSVEAFGIYQELKVPAGGRIVGNAADGDDTVEAGAGVDLAGKTHPFTVPMTIDGGTGNDTITTGAGNDVVNGDDGNDRIAGNSGDDQLNGGANDDIVSGGLGTDSITGGEGADNLSGDNGGDTVAGDDGDDQISGGPGLSRTELTKLQGRWEKAGSKGTKPGDELMDLADTLSGGTGNDRITGHVGNDTIFGDGFVSGSFRDKACADSVGSGGPGLDTLDGQAGDDWIAGGPSADAVTGGEGDDTLCGNEGDDTLEGDEGPASDGTTGGQDELRGGDGNDRVFGRGGRDYADGGPGQDLMATGTGSDVALGGTGSDAVNSGGDGDIVLGDGGTVSGMSYTATAPPGSAGLTSNGLVGTPTGPELESKVSNHDAGGTDGAMSSCLSRVIVLKGSGTGPQGRVDLDGDGAITSADTGRVDGYAVSGGKLDLDGDGNVDNDADDAGVVGDRVVTAGLVDVPVDTALDTLGWKGTGDADCLFGQDGNDAMFGGAGGDSIAEGLGDDLGVGGAGNDTVRGEDGTDLLRGSAGNDELLGDMGEDRLLGNTGDDTLYGGLGKDALEGNEDDDTLYGGEDVDVLVGGTTGTGAADGDDTVYGGQANDFIAGDNAQPARDGGGNAIGLQLEDVLVDKASGDDRLFGGSENDRIYGQGGADSIRGEGNDDDIEGGPGKDTIHGDDGSDAVTGGSGVDTRLDGTARTWETTTDTGDELYGDAGTDTILGDNGVAKTRTLFDVPSEGSEPAAGSYGDDVVSGGTEGDRVFGQSGDDTLAGDGGNDVVDGNSGADTLRGGTEDDVLVGGSQQGATEAVMGEKIDDRDRQPAGEMTARGDLVRGDAGNDVVLGDNGRVTGFGATASVEEYDVWRASQSAAPANASGADQLYGDSGLDRMFGQGQNDLMSGGDDDDVMSGDNGADTMSGNAGADDIVGGSGLAQAPTDLAGVRDDGDLLFGGDEADGTDGADVILGDNGRITRSGTDANTKQAARTVTLYDLAVVAKTSPSTMVSGNDVIRGNADRDLVYGQGGADTIAGDAGDDWLEGNTNPGGSSGSPDFIKGGDGDDDILGGSSNDVTTANGFTGLFGTAGKGGFPTSPNKVLDGGDRLWGDAGNDAVLGDNGKVERTPTNGVWTYQSYKGSGESTTGKLLVRKVLSARGDEGTGAYGDDEGHGNDGHDELYGQLGNDKLEGNAGDDSVLGDLGEVVTSVRATASKPFEADGFIREQIAAGTLKRTTTTYPVPTSVTSGGVGGTDVLLGGLGNDVTHGGSGNDQIWGNRTFVGDSYATLVPTKEASPVGTSGLDDDVIFGGHGDDQVWGGWQHDRLYGGHGADKLDMVTVLNGKTTGDKTVDFKGIDFMYGGWGPDGMQADVSKPSPSNQTDKMVDATGAYNGYFVCEGAYGGNSVMRLLSPSMQSFWQGLAAEDGLVSPTSSKTSGWWELSMVFNSDRGSNANPTYSINPANFVCDN